MQRAKNNYLHQPLPIVFNNKYNWEKDKLLN